MVPNQIARYSWGGDHISGERYVTFERPNSGTHTYELPSDASWSRLMRAVTIACLKPKLQLVLRQHAALEYIDRKVEEAKRKR